MSADSLDFLVISGAYFLMVGLPTFVIYKVKGGAMINLLISSALFCWFILNPGFFRALVVIIFVGFMLIINATSYEQKKTTKTKKFSYEESQQQSINMTEKEREEKIKEILKNNKSNNPVELNIIDCPNCSSRNVQHLGNDKKAFSVGKALGGAALTGGIGTLAGFAGKKGKKDKWHCQNCGNRFEK